MSFLVHLEFLNFNFSQFDPFLKSQIDQNSKLRVSVIVKTAISDIQILPKLISRKTEWQINFCIVAQNFTFSKFLEQGAQCENLIIFQSFRFYVKYFTFSERSRSDG